MKIFLSKTLCLFLVMTMIIPMLSNMGISASEEKNENVDESLSQTDSVDNSACIENEVEEQTIVTYKKEIETVENQLVTSSSGSCGDNLTWVLDDNGTLTISGTGDMYSYNYNAPAPWGNEIQSLVIADGVTSIGRYAFRGCSSITSVTIPDSVTSIGCDAFNGCSSLTSVTIPDSVTSIGEYAFRGCNSLACVTIPVNVTSIDDCTFYGCSSLTSVTIPDGVTSIGRDAFYGCSSLTSVTIPDGVTSIYQSVFEDCSALTNVTIPDSVTSIDHSAFRDCSSLTSVTIPESVTSIGGYAFNDCSSLTSVTIGNSVISISYSAFRNCSSLTSVTIPDGVTSIGRDAFDGCSSLTSVNITDISAWCSIDFGSLSSNPLYYANNLYLNGELMTELVIPDSITSIGDYTFYGCSSLTSVTISDSVTSIGDGAFAYCWSLKSVKIPESVTSISGYAFDNCSALTSVTISDGVTSIGEYAFRDCSSLTSVTIPNGVTYIGGYAFEDCTSLTSVTIPDSVTSIGAYAFEDCTSLTSVNITDISAWCSINFNNYNSNPLSYAKNLYLNGELVTKLVIPDGVTSIGYYTFLGCTSITSVIIPNSVTSISDSAFEYCRSLESVTIPDSVTSIGNSAFRECWSLTSVTIPDSVTSIGDGAFAYCWSLKSVKIPESVTSISGYAFDNCSALTSVKIPESVTRISGYAFNNCKSLTSVTIPDSVTSIYSSAFKDCDNLVIYCLPGSYAETYANSNNIPIVYTVTILSVTIKTLPTKEVYPLNGEVDLSGLELEVTLEDSSTITVTSGYTIGEYDFSTGGEKVINVTFGGFVVTLVVTVDPDLVVYPESDHPYANKTDQSWTYNHPTECDTLMITFSSDTLTESGYDYIYIYELNGNQIGKYSGDQLAGKTVEISGNSFTIRLTSNVSATYYGFSIELIEAIGKECVHIFSDYISNGDATCIKDGTKTAYCDNGCGTTDTVTDEGSATGVHIYGDWEIIAEPTYITNGEQQRKCVNCDAFESETVEKLIPESWVENYVFYLTGADYLYHIRYASGIYETASEIKNAADCVDLSSKVIANNIENGMLKYELPDGGIYSFWIKMSDGTTYIKIADLTMMQQEVVADGVTLTVKNLYGVKDYFIAKGEHTTYADVKANSVVQITKNKIGSKHDYTYILSEPGTYTVCVRYDDTTRAHEFITFEVTVNEPVFTGNGLQLKVGNLEGVKVIRTAYGEYNTPGEIKRAEGARAFTAKTVLKNGDEYAIQYRDEGVVTVAVVYNNGYEVMYTYNVTKKAPVMTQEGSTVTFTGLEDYKVIRYALGEYTTSNQIKNAKGSVTVSDKNMTETTYSVTLTPGTYTFCVQYNDESYNYYVVTVN